MISDLDLGMGDMYINLLKIWAVPSQASSPAGIRRPNIVGNQTPEDAIYRLGPNPYKSRNEAI